MMPARQQQADRFQLVVLSVRSKAVEFARKMPLHPTSQFLVDDLQRLPLLDGRFEGMRLVNFDSVADQQRGCFSLVFRATDTTTGKPVALKFFDPPKTLDAYRLEAFRREHQILRELHGTPRCLQIASGLERYNLKIPSGGLILPFDCEYFAVEWVEEEIDGYFLANEDHSPASRLALLAGIIAAVDVLHSRGVFHRDLKHDNLRALVKGTVREIVAIDLGTAARLSSAPISSPYVRSVGAPAYAAPEALCGLAGNRALAKFTDVYAIGCMLFELFNKDYFFRALSLRNPNYEILLTLLAGSFDHSATPEAQKRAWDGALTRMSSSFTPVPINGAGSDVPAGIAHMLNELCVDLTNVDYRRRLTLARARARVESAIKVLGNERAYQVRLERARELRRRRLDRVRAKEIRLANAKAKRLEGSAC